MRALFACVIVGLLAFQLWLVVITELEHRRTRKEEDE